MSEQRPASGSGEPVLAWLERRAGKQQQQQQSAAEFDNPRLEYRRLFSETWATFLLVLAAAGGGITLGLVSVILGTASGARNVGVNGALAIGGYIGLVVSVWAAPSPGPR